MKTKILMDEAPALLRARMQPHLEFIAGKCNTSFCRSEESRKQYYLQKQQKIMPYRYGDIKPKKGEAVLWSSGKVLRGKSLLMGEYISLGQVQELEKRRKDGTLPDKYRDYVSGPVYISSDSSPNFLSGGDAYYLIDKIAGIRPRSSPPRFRHKDDEIGRFEPLREMIFNYADRHGIHIRISDSCFQPRVEMNIDPSTGHGTRNLFMPSMTHFSSVEDFYNTLLHELAHASRGVIARDLNYAEEEIFAQSVSWMIREVCGINQRYGMETFNDFPYIAGWSATSFAKGGLSGQLERIEQIADMAKEFGKDLLYDFQTEKLRANMGVSPLRELNPKEQRIEAIYARLEEVKSLSAENRTLTSVMARIPELLRRDASEASIQKIEKLAERISSLSRELADCELEVRSELSFMNTALKKECSIPALSRSRNMEVTLDI